MHALAKDERRLREERESFRSRRQEYSGFSRGDMLSGQGSAAGASPSLRRSVRPPCPALFCRVCHFLGSSSVKALHMSACGLVQPACSVHLSVSGRSSSEVLQHASCQGILQIRAGTLPCASVCLKQLL